MQRLRNRDSERFGGLLKTIVLLYRPRWFSLFKAPARICIAPMHKQRLGSRSQIGLAEVSIRPLHHPKLESTIAARAPGGWRYGIAITSSVIAGVDYEFDHIDPRGGAIIRRPKERYLAPGIVYAAH